jgi:hypothetical protein
MENGNKIIELDGQFAGWRAELRGSVTARILLDLESGEASRALKAFSQIVISHNFKGLDGEPVADVLDAPVEALTATLEAWSKVNSINPQ